MVMRLLPQVQQDPQRSPAGQVQGQVTPMRDATGSQIADIGEGMVNLGQNVTKVADLYQDQLDLARSAQSENRLRDVLREQLEAPGTGYFNTVGEDAVAKRKPAFDKIEAARRSIESSLDNEAQKANFRQQADRMLSTVKTLADRHQQEEVRSFRIGQLSARAANSIDEAAKLVGTDQGEVAKLSALRDIEERGALLGWSDEQIHAENMKATTALHDGVVRGLVRMGRGSAASAYLDGNIGEVLADHASDLRGLVQRAAITEQSESVSIAAQQQATEEFSKAFMAREGVAAPTATDIESTWQRAAEIIRRNDKLPVEVRDKALDRLDADYKQVKVNEARMGNAAMESATQWLLANPLAGPSQLPDEIAQAVDSAGARGELNAWANSGKRYSSDPIVASGVLSIPDETLRNTQTDVLVRQFRGRLDDQDFKLLLARQRQALGAASKNDELAISRAKLIEESFRTLKGIDLSASKLTEDQAKAESVYRRNVQKRIDLEPATKEVTPQRLQEILDEVALDTVKVDDFASDTVTNSALLSDADRADAYVTVGDQIVYLRQIDELDRKRYIEKLTRRGRPVTEAEIARLWTIDPERKK